MALRDGVHGLKREKLEVILLVEPSALENLKRQAGSSSKRERIDRELHMCMLFLPRFGLEVKDVNEAVTHLEKVDVAGDEIGIKVKSEAPIAIIRDVVAREVYRYFHGHRHRVIQEHETLKSFMAFFVVRRRGERKRCKTRRMIFLAGDRRMEVGWKLR